MQVNILSVAKIRKLTSFCSFNFKAKIFFEQRCVKL